MLQGNTLDKRKTEDTDSHVTEARPQWSSLPHLSHCWDRQLPLLHQMPSKRFSLFGHLVLLMSQRSRGESSSHACLLALRKQRHLNVLTGTCCKRKGETLYKEIRMHCLYLLSNTITDLCQNFIFFFFAELRVFPHLAHISSLITIPYFKDQSRSLWKMNQCPTNNYSGT